MVIHHLRLQRVQKFIHRAIPVDSGTNWRHLKRTVSKLLFALRKSQSSETIFDDVKWKTWRVGLRLRRRGGLLLEKNWSGLVRRWRLENKKSELFCWLKLLLFCGLLDLRPEFVRRCRYRGLEPLLFKLVELLDSRIWSGLFVCLLVTDPTLDPLNKLNLEPLSSDELRSFSRDLAFTGGSSPIQ